MIKEGKEKREKNSNAVIKTEPSGSQVILPEATVKEEPGTESHLNGVEEGGGSVPTTSSNSSCSHQDLKPSGLIGSTNAGTLAAGRMRNSSGTSDPACLGPGDTVQETKHEESNSQDKPSVTGVVKTEINGNTNHEFQGDRCDAMPMPSSSAPPPNGIQPLPSNVINKQPGTMEAQYMQQQSQIFVFSTTLANKSAEAVLLGQFPSIIAYHCAQPGTKKYLEKHPLKMNQFNRQNPAQWLNNLAQMKQKMNPVTSPAGILKGIGLPGGFQGPPAMMQPEPSGGPGPAPAADMWNQSPMMQQQPCTPGSAPPCPASVQGVKVPDENLTPQQRQHREEQLARLRNMQQMLFPEQESPSAGPEGCLDNGNGPPPGMMGPGGAILPHKGMMMAGSNQITPTSVAAQIEWQKLQHQFYEERKKKGPSGLGMGGSGIGSPAGPCQARGGPRAQGPPPPYHQTPRSASVPTAMPSPNPSSPNNPTSNLSLPSPRAASALNSPAEPNRQQFGGNQGRIGPSPTSLDSPNASRPLNPSNPGTPVSTHLSPNAARKELSQNSSEFSSGSSQANSSSQQPTVDGMFGRTLQSLAQQKQLQQPHQSSKEPNLMPVPSPQQIQYLNTFEGQELTIQKQPNTSLKDTNIRSPSNPPAGLDGGLQTDNSRLSGGPGTPLTPTSLSNYPPTSSDLSRFPIPSPHTPNASSNDGSKPQQQRQQPALNKTPTNDPVRFLSSSPQMGDGMGPPNFLGPPHFLEVSPVPPAGGMDVSPTGFRTENVPLNPNGNLACNGKAAHFDPISSMAQMSQQLTNSVANSPNPGGMMGGPNMMPFNPGMDLDSCQGMQEPGPQPSSFVNVPQPHAYSPNPGMIPCSPANPQPSMHTGCGSPKPGNMMMGVRGAPPYAGGQRMMGRPPGPSPYNGANVQVKASAPNTIQYLPAKPQAGNPGPRGPPSLEFLQRFTNPLSNLDTKMPTHNLQYFPHSNQPNMGGVHMSMNRHPNGVMVGPGPYGPPGSLIRGPMGGPGPHGDHMGLNGPVMGPNGSLGPCLPPISGGMVMGPGGPGMGMAPLRGSLRPGGIMRMQQMGGQMFGGPPNIGQPGGPEQMFSGGPGQNMPGGNFVPGSKSSPMGLGNAPDASQPLPPSMGQSNNFKNSPFIGPTTADPNYAQQFHNFQQQLYATNTRSQMSNQTIGPNQSFFVPK